MSVFDFSQVFDLYLSKVSVRFIPCMTMSCDFREKILATFPRRLLFHLKEHLCAYLLLYCGCVQVICRVLEIKSNMINASLDFAPSEMLFR